GRYDRDWSRAAHHPEGPSRALLAQEIRLVRVGVRCLSWSHEGAGAQAPARTSFEPPCPIGYPASSERKRCRRCPCCRWILLSARGAAGRDDTSPAPRRDPERGFRVAHIKSQI